jgi:hypothetical protein
MRLVQRAPLHVSVMSTVSSQRRCSPMFSGEGPPAAAQLPGCIFSLSCCHSTRMRREYANTFCSMCLRTALDVPPSGRMVRPRRQTSSIVPSNISSWALMAKTALPNS